MPWDIDFIIAEENRDAESLKIEWNSHLSQKLAVVIGVKKKKSPEEHTKKQKKKCCLTKRSCFPVSNNYRAMLNQHQFIDNLYY